MLGVSLTLVVLNAKLPCWLRRTQTKHDGETQRQWHFYEVEHKHLTSVAVLVMHTVTSLLCFL